MIAEFIVWVASQIPGLLVGAIAGAVLTFFYIQHKLKSDPDWVENLYQKQRGISMQGTEKMEALEQKVKDYEYKEQYEKIKADIIKELKG